MTVRGIAASELGRELQQLTGERDRALSTAQDSINAKYLSSLQALLRRAVQIKDAQSAAQIAEAIGKITVIGSWSVVCDNGFKTQLDIRPDGTFSGSAGNTSGSWAIREGKLLIINPTNQDIYDLPAKNTMTGATTTGVTMVATRVNK